MGGLHVRQGALDVHVAGLELLLGLAEQLLHVVAVPEELGLGEGHAQASLDTEGFRSARPVAGSALVRTSA